MKKSILLLFALLAFTGTSFAQSTIQTDGVVHVIADANVGAADSMHTMGIVNMTDGLFAADSLNILVEAGDSLNFRVYLVPIQDLSTETVADSVAGCAAIANVATGGFQMTADGFAVVPWHNIAAGIGQHRTRAKAYRVYVNVYAVGSEVTSSGKKFKVTARVFK